MVFTVERHVDPSQLRISRIKEIGAHTAKRWYQYVNYGEMRQRLVIQTPEFYAAQPVESKYKDNTFQLAIPYEAMEAVLKVDEFVRQHIELPANAPATWRQQHSIEEDTKGWYKDMRDREVFYVPLEPGAAIFNRKREPITTELGAGSYKVLVQIRGVYIGTHGTLTDKFASLQMRIIQLIYTPEEGLDKCLFLTDEDDIEEGSAPTRLEQVLVPSLDDIMDSIANDPPVLSTMESQLEPVNPPVESRVEEDEAATTTTSPSMSNGSGVVEKKKKKQSVVGGKSTTTRASGSYRKRKPAGLTLKMPPTKQKTGLSDEGKALMSQYHFWNYPTTEVEESEYQWRLEHLAEIERKLVTVLGGNWQTDFYNDFEALYSEPLLT